MEELCREKQGYGAKTTAGTSLGDMVAVNNSVKTQVKVLELCVFS